MPSLATWFTPSLQTISRSAGRSSVLAAAYRACTKLTDERLGITTDYTPKGKHGLAGNICIGIPDDNIEKLFNSAEEAETRANSTVARELMIPLASGWSDHERRECVRAIAQMLRDEYGVAVLASIHRPARDNNNDHAHILFTTRTVDSDGVFGKKTRILDDAKTGEVKKMREAVCAIVNEHAIANGSDWYVYAGKFSDVLEDHIPTKHISITAGKSQKARIDSNRQEVKEARMAIAKTQKEIAAIDAKIEALQTQPVIAETSQKAPPMPDKSDKEVTVSIPTKAPLTRIAMTPEAEKAFGQTEKAKTALKEAHALFESWENHKKELEANRPNFLIRLFSDYDKKLNEANAKMQECEEFAIRQKEIVLDPERKRLCGIYHQTISHNVHVREQEVIAEKAHAERVREEALEQALREQGETSRVDWSASLAESIREMEARRERASATEYNSGDGMGM